MTAITKQTEWESESVRLVRLGGLSRSPKFPAGLATRSRYYTRPSRVITEVFVHHSAGPSKHGIAAPEGIASWCARSPLYNAAGKRIGGGRGWPGIPYTFVVPTTPEVVDGKFEVYRCWDDEWHTWHTGGSHNANGVGVCMAGWFASRHGHSDIAQLQPNPDAMICLEALVLDYLMPRYGLEPADALFGHFDAGKKMCPGDFLEQWVRQTRGEDWVSPLFGSPPADEDKLDDRALLTARQRQEALVELGYDLGPAGIDGKWGFFSRSALESFQANSRITVDGYWGPQTERTMREALVAG